MSDPTTQVPVLKPVNRIEGTSIAVAPSSAPQVNGAPVMGQGVVKVASAVVGIAAILSQVLPPYTIAAKVFAVLAALGGLLGGLSPGLRK